METAIITSYLRYLAYWKASDASELHPSNPSSREIETRLYKDFMKAVRIVKVADIN